MPRGHVGGCVSIMFRFQRNANSAGTGQMHNIPLRLVSSPGECIRISRNIPGQSSRTYGYIPNQIATATFTRSPTQSETQPPTQPPTQSVTQIPDTARTYVIFLIGGVSKPCRS